MRRCETEPPNHHVYLSSYQVLTSPLFLDSIFLHLGLLLAHTIVLHHSLQPLIIHIHIPTPSCRTIWGHPSPRVMTHANCHHFINLKSFCSESHTHTLALKSQLTSPQHLSCSEDSSGMWWQKQPRITVSWLYQGCPHHGTADGVYTMLVVHEFFDVLPLYLIEVCCRELPQCWDSHSIFTEKSSRLERGLDHLYPQPGCPNYPEIFGWPTLPWLIIDAFLPCLRKETLTSVNIAWILFPLTT